MLSDIADLNTLPLITADIPGIAGIIKKRAEDFIVEEIPAYEFSGQGTHVLLQIEKKGMPTLPAIHRLATALGVPRRDVGYAGLKDARAVTRQWLSIEHIDPDRLLHLDLPQIKILQTTRHHNKLKLGHLSANRFILRIRRLALPLDQALFLARQVADICSRRGVPNYFGPQRFGQRSDGHLLGAAIINRRPADFIDRFLGGPSSLEMPQVIQARALYDQALYQQAHDSWPPSYHEERRALRNLIKNQADKTRTFNIIDKTLKQFYISAFQSHLFNLVLAARMPHIDQLLPGDLAYLHRNGACFPVIDPLVEQPRCAAFEISPTGPLYGYRMSELSGPAGQIENTILAQTGLQKADFRQMGYYRVKGARRPLRFQPRHINLSIGADDLGDFLQLSFELDPGCYATTFLREITKSPNLY